MELSLLKRFQDFASKEFLFRKEGHYLLAFSGGVDSVVLCDLMFHAGIHFSLAHVHFGLRGQESDDDQVFADSIAQKHNLSFFTVKFDTATLAQERKTGIQETARDLRYQWLNNQLNTNTSKPFDAVITAHHADDNIETVWQNILRGTGLNGLCGMEPKGGGMFGNIIRPLLFATKNEIIAYANEKHLSWREDSSNQTNDYSRNLLRHEVLPVVACQFPDSANNMRENILRFRDTHFLFSYLWKNYTDKFIVRQKDEMHLPVLKLLKTPGYASLLHHLLAPLKFSASQIKEAVDLLHAETGRFISNSSYRIIRNRKWLIISPLQCNQNLLAVVGEMDEELKLDNLCFKISKHGSDLQISKNPQTAVLDSGLLQFPLIVRHWKKGDYFYPLGLNKKKKLSDFFINEKLSLSQKEKVIIVESAGRIIWVAGMRIDHRFRVTEKTTSVIRLTMSE
jgi:tRNA(Ile)-lysidine synthase